MAVSAGRVGVGVGLGALGVGALLDPRAYALLVTAIAGGALYELVALLDASAAGAADAGAARRGGSLIAPVAAAATLAYPLLGAAGTLGAREGALLAATLAAALAWALFDGGGRVAARAGATLLATLYVGKALSYFTLLRGARDGLLWSLMLILIVAATDVFAMLIGRAVGRRPLCAVSPRKTVEGACGGVAAAALAAAGCAAVAHAPCGIVAATALGVATSVAAQLGDVVESALKRDAGVKDAGTLLAGHGGVLDRFDSYLFGGAVFYAGLSLCAPDAVRAA